MDCHEATLELLDQVSEHQRNMHKAVKEIRSMKYRTFGRNLVAVSEEQRTKMIHSAVTQCNQKCKALYNIINRERQKAGLPELKNPYRE